MMYYNIDISNKIYIEYEGYKDMKYNVDKLTKRLEESERIQIQQQSLIKELQSENNLLSSTILTKEMGKISEERRKLHKEVRESKDNERRAVVELQNYKAEYDSKYDELTERLQDVKSKQAAFDDYIASEAAEMIKDEQKNLQKQYSAKAQSLKDKYTTKAEQLNEKITFRDRIICFIGIYAAIITAILIIWR